jgi:hypothetical protein
MYITPKEGSSSFKKKDLAFKASHDKKKMKSQAMIVQESSSESDIDDASLALMVRKTTKMLKKVNKSGIKFDGKKKEFFTSSKRKPISEMDCYNCGELGHLAHQCPKPQKDKYKNKNKGKNNYCKIYISQMAGFWLILLRSLLVIYVVKKVSGRNLV